MLGETLALEERSLTIVSVRPGVVDTQMQVDLRSKHFPKMLPENVKKFASMHEQGTMLKPEQPGNVMARLVLNAPKDLSGHFVQCVHYYLLAICRLTQIGGTAQKWQIFKTKARKLTSEKRKHRISESAKGVSIHRTDKTVLDPGS